MPWTPLLEGAARDRALDVAVAVADALLAAPPEPGSLDARPTLTGTLGATLFLAALGETTGERTYAGAAATLLDDAIDAASGLERPALALYDAPLGVGWADTVLRPRLPGGTPADDGDDDLDVFVSHVLRAPSWPWPLDLMHGLAGVGVYCLARLPRESARRGLAAIVGHLAGNAVEDGDGVTWPYVPAPDGPFTFNEHRPEGHVNVGFAHGVPGIVAFLAAAATAGTDGARDLLAPAVRWLAARRRAQGGAFPRFVIDGEPVGSRLAWCYGDPGVAVALTLAGAALGDGGVTDLARDVARGCAAQRTDDEDATLCHGSAGLTHVFGRLGNALADERVLDLARAWADVAVTRHAEGLTLVDRERVKALVDAGERVLVEPGYGFLFGAAGAGLALTAAAADTEPWWDGVLFVQPPGSWPG